MEAIKLSILGRAHGVVPFRLQCDSPTRRFAYYTVGVPFRLQAAA